MDKWATKLVAGAVGIAIAPGRAAHRGDRGDVRLDPPGRGEAGRRRLQPRRHAWCARPTTSPPALDAAFALDDRVLVEDVVVGREIDVAVLGRAGRPRLVAPALEIVVDGIFDYDTKYDGARRLPRPRGARPATSARRSRTPPCAVYDALGCAGVARVDFFLTEDGPVLNEVNTMPGFTEQSQVPKMFAAAGTSYAELLDLLVRDALAAA